MTTEISTAFKLIDRLDAEFPSTQSLIVGGAVRDFLIGDNDPHDIDLATNIPFDRLATKFDLEDITKNTVNAQPVSIIKFDGFVFEIAQFRTDSLGTDRRNNVATIVNTFAEDSARRDITINALGLNSKRVVIDPQGGRLDLINQLIKCVGDPDSRFKEDATRILRVLRFAAKLQFSIHPDTLDAVVRNRELLLDRSRISQESIAKEIFKVASNGVAFARFIQLLDATGISELILPEWHALNGLTHDPAHHPEGGSTVKGHIIECLIQGGFDGDPVSNIAIFCHDLGKATTRADKENGHSSYHGHESAGVPIVEALFERLRFNDLTQSDKEAILIATKKHMLIHDLDELNPSTLAKLVLNNGWTVLKHVGFADEASRGADLFNLDEFTAKIARAEERVSRIAKNRDELRLRVKEHVDGNILLDWFPHLQSNRTLMSPTLKRLAEFIVDRLDAGIEFSRDDIKKEAEAILFE